jgi:threonine/homoserine efflux transporter RhtA
MKTPCYHLYFPEMRPKSFDRRHFTCLVAVLMTKSAVFVATFWSVKVCVDFVCPLLTVFGSWFLLLQPQSKNEKEQIGVIFHFL